MKKRYFIALILALSMLLAVIPGALALEPTPDGYVTDKTGTLDSIEIANIEEQAKAASEQYDCGIYVVMVYNYKTYSKVDDLFSYCVDYYGANGLGLGDDHNGVILMMDMMNRDYTLVFHGATAENAFTEFGKDQLEARFLKPFGKDEFAEGFEQYVSCCAELLQAAQDGTPVDGERDLPEEEVSEGGFTILFFAPGLLAAVITAIVTTSMMHSAKQSADADAYMRSGSLNITRKTDQFINRTVTRQARPKETSHGTNPSGSSNHSSGDYSGRSGKF